MLDCLHSQTACPELSGPRSILINLHSILTANHVTCPEPQDSISFPLPVHFSFWLATWSAYLLLTHGLLLSLLLSSSTDPWLNLRILVSSDSKCTISTSAHCSRSSSLLDHPLPSTEVIACQSSFNYWPVTMSQSGRYCLWYWEDYKARVSSALGTMRPFNKL